MALAYFGKQRLAPYQDLANALNETTSLTCDEVSVPEVIHYLSERHGVLIELSNDAVSDSNFLTPHVTCTISDVPLKDALHQILDPHNLDYLIQGGVIIIVPKDDPALGNRGHGFDGLTQFLVDVMPSSPKESRPPLAQPWDEEMRDDPFANDPFADDPFAEPKKDPPETTFQ